MLDRRGHLLRAALGFAGLPLPSYDRFRHALRAWLDSWTGIGRVAVRMARQGYDIQLTRYDEEGWRSTRPGWSMHPPVRRAPAGSARHGTRRSARRGRHSGRRTTE